jgi:hypothetical protein
VLEELGENLGESIQTDVESMLEHAVETRDRESRRWRRTSAPRTAAK